MENGHPQKQTEPTPETQSQIVDQNSYTINTPTVPQAPQSAEAPTAIKQAPKFPVGKLILIVFGPGALLVSSFIVQFFNRFLFTSVTGGESVSGGVVGMIINLISLLLGFVAVAGIVLMPVFVILLVLSYNRQKNTEK